MKQPFSQEGTASTAATEDSQPFVEDEQPPNDHRYFVNLVPFPSEFQNEADALLSYNEYGLWHKI